MFQAGHRRLSELSPVGMSRPELVDHIEALAALSSHVEERLLAFTAAIEALGDRGADAATVLRSAAHRSSRRAKRDAATATQVAQMPKTAAAMAAGEISAEHAAICASAAEATTPAEADVLASVAAAMPADRFGAEVRKWAGKRESQRTVEERHRQQHRDRDAFHWAGENGMTNLMLVMPKDVADGLVPRWDGRVDALRRADKESGGDRTLAQLRHDALVQLITEDGGAMPPHPRFVGHFFFNLDDGAATWADGTPVPSAVLATIGPAAEIVGHVFAEGGRPLYLSRRCRVASVDQWLSLIAIYRGCDECGAGVSLCQAHHLHEWLDGGPTDLDNLQLLCHTCHGRVHRGSRGDPRAFRERSPVQLDRDPPDQLTLAT